MTTVDDTVARLEQLVRQQAEQIAGLQMRQANTPDGKQDGLPTPPTTYPEGAIPGDRRPRKIRERELAIAKMRVLARTHGGMWEPDPRVPRLYGHRPGDGVLTMPCERLGDDDFGPSCQRTCWTPERETRFLYALKLQDMATGPLVPLTPPDPKDRDALLELVGLLKGQATTADVAGRYPERPPTREEVGTAQGAVRVRKIA